MARFAMVIDTRKCVGCMDCVVACQVENDVPAGYCRDWITTEVRGEFPHLAMEIRSERCNHCDNPPCVNPSHLFSGGAVDNNRDAVEKGRYIDRPAPNRPRGVEHPHVKLTEDQVRRIRDLYARGGRQDRPFFFVRTCHARPRSNDPTATKQTALIANDNVNG